MLGVGPAYLLGVGKNEWDGLCKRHLAHFKVNREGDHDKDGSDAVSDICCSLFHSQPRELLIPPAH